MRWEMEEVESVLEKIWDLHDKVSDAIHSISRSRFLKSIGKNSKPSLSADAVSTTAPAPPVAAGTDRRNGFVFMKGIDESALSVAEAKSLNSIRTALEDLEDQLDFFHTVQSQQQVEWDAAVARVEQSRAILAMRLSEHQGRKYKVIEEAMAFVSDINTTDTDIFASCGGPCLRDPKHEKGKGLGLGMLMQQVLSSSASLAKGSVGGILGNAAVFAVSVLALLQLNQIACRNGGAHGVMGTDKGSFGKRRTMVVDRSVQLSFSRG